MCRETERDRERQRETETERGDWGGRGLVSSLVVFNAQATDTVISRQTGLEGFDMQREREREGWGGRGKGWGADRDRRGWKGEKGDWADLAALNARG